MKKTVVLNELKRSEDPKGCSSIFSKPDPLEVLRGDIKSWERECSDRLNKTGGDGFELKDERIYSFKIVDTSEKKPMNRHAAHGVYLFEKSEAKHKYKVYMGPLIVLPKPETGCADFKDLGCSSKGKSPGCKKEKSKPIGCNQAKITSEQYINFFNNALNTENVRAINAHNGWRTDYKPERDDFMFSSFENPNENVLYFWHMIQQQVDKDLAELQREGMGFERNILLPAEHQAFSTGLLFSTKQTNAVMINKTSGMQAFLSGFELMYLKGDKSLLDILAAIPVFGIFVAILRMFIGDDEKQDKTRITDANLRRIEEIYEADLNKQEDIINRIESTKKAIVGKMQVIFAIPVEAKKGLLQYFTGGLIPVKTHYEFITAQIDLSNK